MLDTIHPGAPSADEVAALFTGVRLLDDAVGILEQVRVELERLVVDSHWEADAVRLLRTALIDRRCRLDPIRADIAAQRDACVMALS
ncbi:hypothetical protein AB0N64_09855 [Microbacterium sp. NPDC089318]